MRSCLIFAECGFEGQTRELHKRLGITQPLLYRYFPSKEASSSGSIRKFSSGAGSRPGSRSSPIVGNFLRARLVHFYHEYAEVIHIRVGSRSRSCSRAWKNLGLNACYSKTPRERAFEKVIEEIRSSTDALDWRSPDYRSRNRDGVGASRGDLLSRVRQFISDALETDVN